jgi:anti-sigma factor RsiW
MPASGDICSWTRDRVDSYLDGELRGDELQAFEDHVRSCPSCRSELALARSTLEELRALPVLECPQRVVEQVAERAGAGLSAGLWERLAAVRPFVPKPAMAAVVMVIVAATAYVLLLHEQPMTPSPPKSPALSEKDAEVAKAEVMLAFAYVGKYSRRTGEIIRKEVIEDRVIEPVGKTMVEPVYSLPFQGSTKEEAP